MRDKPVFAFLAVSLLLALIFQASRYFFPADAHRGSAPELPERAGAAVRDHAIAASGTRAASDAESQTPMPSLHST